MLISGSYRHNMETIRRFLELLGLGIVISTPLVCSGCITASRVPMHAFGNTPVMYLTYTESIPGNIAAGVATNGVRTAGIADLIEAAPAVVEAYKSMSSQTKIRTVEFYIGDTNRLTSSELNSILQTFEDIVKGR